MRRRSLLQKLAALAGGVGLITGSAAVVTDSPFSDGDQAPTSGQGGDTAAKLAMIGKTTQFSPYTISTEETSILESRWEFQTLPPIPANNYQLDILVNADRVNEPTTRSTNVSLDDIIKKWEYRSSSPVGSAYHWQAKLWAADVFGGSAMVDAEIVPNESGDVDAKTGTFWPWQSWATATLSVE